MRVDAALLSLQAAAIVLAMGAALVWPRAGQVALMVPLGTNDLRDVVRWADRENTELIAMDSTSGRILVRVPSNRSLLMALGSGLLPMAARAGGCKPDAPGGPQG